MTYQWYDITDVPWRAITATSPTLLPPVPHSIQNNNIPYSVQYCTCHMSNVAPVLSCVLYCTAKLKNVFTFTKSLTYSYCMMQDSIIQYLPSYPIYLLFASQLLWPNSLVLVLYHTICWTVVMQACISIWVDPTTIQFLIKNQADAMKCQKHTHHILEMMIHSSQCSEGFYFYISPHHYMMTWCKNRTLSIARSY